VGSLVDQVLLQQVVQGMIRRQNGDPLAELRRRLEVINAFDVPPYQYSPERRTFTVAASAPKLHGSAGGKADYLRERYVVHKQRLLRHAMFAPPVSGADPDTALKVAAARASPGSCGARRPTTHAGCAHS
jgi:DNA polymerase epsilon subunit 2